MFGHLAGGFKCAFFPSLLWLLTITILSDDNDADQTASTGEKETNGMIMDFHIFSSCWCQFLMAQSPIRTDPWTLWLADRSKRIKEARCALIVWVSQAKAVGFIRKMDHELGWFDGGSKFRNFPKQTPLELRKMCVHDRWPLVKALAVGLRSKGSLWEFCGPVELLSLCSDLDNPDQCLSMAPRIRWLRQLAVSEWPIWPDDMRWVSEAKKITPSHRFLAWGKSAKLISGKRSIILYNYIYSFPSIFLPKQT